MTCPCKDRRKVERMCEYCRELTNAPREYQRGTYGSISLVKFGIKTLLITEINKCPKSAQCTSKDMPIKQGYEINYCPHCGAKMDENIPEDIPIEYFENGGN